MNVIELKDISFGYDKTLLFQGLSAAFGEGDFCAVMGPNGSGKTTLLKCICGLLKPSCGEVLVMGKPVAAHRTEQLARLVSYVPQRHDAVFDITVHDLVMTGRYPYQKKWQLPGTRDERAVDEMLERCNLTGLRHRMLASLSGGEMQRALIARAMAQQAPVMLLDEPLSNLDVTHRYEIMDILAGLNRKGVTVLIIMHDIPIAVEYVTSALLMSGGTLLAHGSKEQALAPELLRQCFALGNAFQITEQGYIYRKCLNEELGIRNAGTCDSFHPMRKARADLR